MNIAKANWSTTDTQVRITVPLQKVDKENRLVSGFATLDNIDNHGDVVLASASQNAFQRFRGNIREMHQPIAVGVLREFTEKSFYGPDGKPYTGVFVTVYVSKGAQDTWEKVLDGTLSGFSIGGEIRDSEVTWVKDANANIRFIKEYDLVELSLVDNPANQLSNIFSITKSADGMLVKGMAADTTMINVFWCESDEVAVKSSGEFANCPVCEKSMTSIGWYEEMADNGDSKVAEMVDKFLRQKEDSTDTQVDEGGVTVAKEENVEKAETVEDVVDETVVKSDEVVEDSDAAQDEVSEEEAVSTDEVTTDEADVAKMFDALRDSIEKTIDASNKANAEKVEEVQRQLTEFSKTLDEKTSEVLEKYNTLSEQLNSIKETSSEVEKRLEVIESSTAVKKSGDGDDTKPEKKVQKGLWGGTFFGE